MAKIFGISSIVFYSLQEFAHACAAFRANIEAASIENEINWRGAQPGDTLKMEGPSPAQHEDATLLPVSLSTSILAVVIALVSLLGHRAHTRTIFAQNRASSEWVDYAAKATGRASYDALLDFLAVAQLRDTANAGKVRDKCLQQIEQSDREQKEIEARADALEREVAGREHAADRFDFGNGCLEAALVIMSVTLLTRRKLYWGIGLALAGVGLVIASSGFFVG
jgi:Domain of unknown function (DUF4337)